MNDYASAKQAYTASSVMTAPPHTLVVMLYDGAIRFLRQSAAGMRAGSREVSVNRMQRAGAIIDELNISLDMSQGEVSTRLRSIYLFCRRHLNDALIERDPEQIDEVVELLGELRDAWQQIAASVPVADDAAAAAQ
jgi:flagellar protein FliS